MLPYLSILAVAALVSWKRGSRRLALVLGCLAVAAPMVQLASNCRVVSAMESGRGEVVEGVVRNYRSSDRVERFSISGQPFVAYRYVFGAGYDGSEVFGRVAGDGRVLRVTTVDERIVKIESWQPVRSREASP